MNQDLNVKLTPNADSPLYCQCFQPQYISRGHNFRLGLTTPLEDCYDVIIWETYQPNICAKEAKWEAQLISSLEQNKQPKTE